MKFMNKLITILGLALVATTAQAYREYDLLKGVDISSQTNVTGSLLNQLVDNGTVNTNKGLMIRSATHPNVTDNNRYTNFLWFDTTTITLKYYSGTGDTVTNWLPAIGINVVSATNIADYSITSTKLGTNSVLEYAIASGAVTSTKINDGSVILGKIGIGAVTNENLAFASVNYDKIAAGTIQTTNLADSIITSNKIAASAINNSKIFDYTIIASNKLASNSIANWNLASNSVAGSNIMSGTITSNNIAAGTINNSLLATNASYGQAVAWCFARTNGTILKGFGISSVVMCADGVFAAVFATARSSTNYATFITPFNADGGQRAPNVVTNATDRVSFEFRNAAAGLTGPRDGIQIIVFDF